MQFNKKPVLLAIGVGLLAIAAGCTEKQYTAGGNTAGGNTPAASTKAPIASPAAAPDDGRAKPGSDDPTAK